jgi:hypothetical protein
MRTSKITTALALTALVVAVLGSTPLGHAAGSILPRSSVGTPQLKKSAVTAAKLKNNSVTGAKVLDGSLTAADLKAGAIPAGPKGDPGLSGLETVVVSSSFDSTSPKTAYADCPAGKRVISVGGQTGSGTVPVAIANALKISETTGMVAAFEASATSSNWLVTAAVVCANAS